MNKLKIIAIVSAAAIFAFACGQSASTPNNATGNANSAKTNTAATPQPAATADRLASAADLYKTNCADCHKADGKGGKVTVDGKDLEPDDLTTAKMKSRTDEKFTRDIHDGMPDDGMPAFKDKLTDAQIKEVISYIRVLQKDKALL